MSFNTITQEIENFFAETPRIFATKQDLVKALGCTLEFVDRIPLQLKGLGQAPSPGEAQLMEGNHIIYTDWAYAIHEAVHAFCGPDSLLDESKMMALEVSLYAMLQDPADRHKMFDFFSSSYAEDQDFVCDEVGCLMQREDPEGFCLVLNFEPVWNGLVRDADDLWFTAKGQLRKSVLKRLTKNLGA